MRLYHTKIAGVLLSHAPGAETLRDDPAALRPIVLPGWGEGDEYPDDAAACRAAVQTMLDIARSEMTAVEGRRKISVTVADAAGHCIFASSITLDAVHLR